MEQPKKPNIGRLKNKDVVRVRYTNGYETQHTKEIADRLRRRGSVVFIDENLNPPRREVKVEAETNFTPAEKLGGNRGRRPGMKSDETKTLRDKPE